MLRFELVFVIGLWSTRTFYYQKNSEKTFLQRHAASPKKNY